MLIKKKGKRDKFEQKEVLLKSTKTNNEAKLGLLGSLGSLTSFEVTNLMDQKYYSGMAKYRTTKENCINKRKFPYDPTQK